MLVDHGEALLGDLQAVVRLQPLGVPAREARACSYLRRSGRLRGGPDTREAQRSAPEQRGALRDRPRSPVVAAPPERGTWAGRCSKLVTEEEKSRSKSRTSTNKWILDGTYLSSSTRCCFCGAVSSSAVPCARASRVREDNKGSQFRATSGCAWNQLLPQWLSRHPRTDRPPVCPSPAKRLPVVPAQTKSGASPPVAPLFSFRHV